MSKSVTDNSAPGDTLLGFDEIKAELLTLLDDVDTHSLGSFATSGTVPQAVNPGLTINGLGGVGLPLSVRDAWELSKIAHQAPFGKGTETFVDTNVRKTWELDPSQFTLQNPEWQQCVHGLTTRVATELGILRGDKDVRAELYKLLLYEEGAFFDHHKDSEKAEGMFGTLVIALPSSHLGGDVEASFGDQKQILSTSPSSQFGFSYLAWYADVEHAVLPVTSGYRLVLTYNLISHGEPQSAAVLGDDHAKLCRLLASWARSNEEAPEKMAYLLDHQYTETGLRLNRLKGSDLRKAEFLKKACDEQDYCVFLAQLELSREGACDEPEDGYGYGYGSSYNGDYHEHFDDIETELRLLKVFEMDGKEIATNVDLDEEDLVQEDPFKDEKPDDEDFSGYTGNEGVTSTHFYRRTCIVVVPRSAKIDFLFESQLKRNTDVAPWANSMLQKLSETPEDVHVRVDLESLCDLIIARNVENKDKAPMGDTYYSWEQPRPVPDTSLSTGALVALRLRRPDLFEKLAQVAHDMLLPSVYEGLGKVIAQDGLKEWQLSCVKAFLPIAKIRSHSDALGYVRKGFDAEESPGGNTGVKPLITRLWETLLSKLEDTLAKPDTDDVEPLLEMASDLGEGSLLGPIASFVEKHISQVDFVISFLHLLKDKNTIGEKERNQLHRDIHSRLAVTFNLQSAFINEDFTPNRFPKRQRCGRQAEETQRVHDRIERFVTFLEQSVYWDLSENVVQIIDTIAAEVPNINNFAAVLIPFLRSSAKTVLNVDKTGHYRSLVYKTVKAYIERYVGLEPVMPQDWSRPSGGCGCFNCKYLSNWLLDPLQKLIRYDGIVQPPKKHLMGMLNREHDCYCEYDKKVSPHGLIIIKTQSRWQEALRNWTRRSKEAVDNIKSIAPEPILKSLIGDQYHDLINVTAQRLPANTPRKEPPSVTITKVTPKSPEPRSLSAAITKNQIMAGRTSSPSLGRPPLTASNAQNRPAPPQTAGVKRPYAQVDIVDLTEPGQEP